MAYCRCVGDAAFASFTQYSAASRSPLVQHSTALILSLSKDELRRCRSNHRAMPTPIHQSEDRLMAILASEGGLRFSFRR